MTLSDSVMTSAGVKRSATDEGDQGADRNGSEVEAPETSNRSSNVSMYVAQASVIMIEEESFIELFHQVFSRCMYLHSSFL